MWVLRENGFAIYSWLELLDEIDLCGQVVGISVQPYASGMSAERSALVASLLLEEEEIGRASCRERV